ncbi:MAG: hypothetical protein H6737_03415 [Alphaproteobacteria bacterium]|nr:hypothetical protein [Alphaproteobacteria bacterium]
MDKALERLRDPEGRALTDLARLVVDETTATPLKSIAHPRWIASQLATALEALTRGDLARQFVERRVDQGRERLEQEQDPLRAHWPAEVDGPLREVLSHEWTPDEDMVFRMLDQPAMRSLVAEILTTMLTRFRKRMRSLEPGLLKGLGGRAAKRGKSLFGGMAGNLTGLAENVVGAVKDEVEQGLDELVREFVEGATRDTVRSIAGYIAASEHQGAFADLRLGVLDVILDTPIHELVGELDKARPMELVDVVLGGVRAAISEEGFVDRAEERIAQVLDEAGDGTLGAWLDEVQLREVWAQTTTELVAQRLTAVVQTPAFEAWWRELHAD